MAASGSRQVAGCRELNRLIHADLPVSGSRSSNFSDELRIREGRDTRGIELTIETTRYACYPQGVNRGAAGHLLRGGAIWPRPEDGKRFEQERTVQLLKGGENAGSSDRRRRATGPRWGPRP